MTIRSSLATVDLGKRQCGDFGKSLDDFSVAVEAGTEGAQTEMGTGDGVFGPFACKMSRFGAEMSMPPDVSTALEYGLELASQGAMLVAADGCPRFANRAALAILEEGDGLTLAKNALVARRPSDTRLLFE